MAIIPNPRTWSHEDTVTALALNEDLKASFEFLLNPPRAMVWNNTGQFVQRDGSDPNGGTAVLLWNEVTFDTDGMFNPAANPFRLVAQTPGVYEIILHVEWQNNNQEVAGNRYAAIKKNSTGADLGTFAEIAFDEIYIRDFDALEESQINHVSIHHYLAAGDWVEAVVRNTTTAALSTVPPGNAEMTFFAARWIGAS